MLTLHIKEYQVVFFDEDNLIAHKQKFIDIADMYSLKIECQFNHVSAIGRPEQLFKLLHDLARIYTLKLL